MASFKTKPNKIKFMQDIKTLDEMHNVAVLKFDGLYKETPEIKKRLSHLKKEFSKMEKVKTNNKKKMDIKNEINDLEKKLREIENCVDELDYFDKAGDILLKYYENDFENSNNIEDLNNIENDINMMSDLEDFDITEDAQTDMSEKKETVQTKISNTVDSKDLQIGNVKPIDDENEKLRKTMMMLNDKTKKDMKIKKPVKKRRTVPEQPPTRSILSFLTCEEDSVNNNVEVMTNNKATLKDEYMALMDSSYVCEKFKKSTYKKCLKCNVNKFFVQTDGLYACPKCGESEHLIADCDAPNNKESVNEKPKYPYKKINHLIEKLNQYQSKESTAIPSYIYETIKNELKKQVVSINEVTPKIIKEILKKHKFNNFYEHHQHIFSKVTGTPPPTLTREIEEKIKVMFKQIQEPFKKHKNPTRSNFLNYAYVLHKIFMILDMPNHAKYFTLLKSREKLRQQDSIWRLICKDLNWPFHPSL